MAKSTSGTILNTRVSYKAKQELLAKVVELSTTDEFKGDKLNMSMLIKAAIKTTWGIDCDNYE